MRDDNYRKMLTNSNDYDRVIDWIKENNPYARKDDNPEEFATFAVNSTIRAAQYDNKGATSTGCALAFKTSYGDIELCIKLPPKNI